MGNPAEGRAASPHAHPLHGNGNGHSNGHALQRHSGRPGDEEDGGASVTEPLLDKRVHVHMQGGVNGAQWAEHERLSKGRALALSTAHSLALSSGRSSSGSRWASAWWLMALLACLALCVPFLLPQGRWSALLSRYALSFSFPSSSSSFSSSSSSASSSLCSSTAAASPSFHALYPVGTGRTLVVVVHASHDAMYARNLDYFVVKAVRCWQDADYVFVIQRDDAAQYRPGDERWKADLPPLPVNARYVLHQNECLDIGSVGWLLALPPAHPDHVDTARYRYFVLLNTSVRGPTLPLPLEDRMDPHSAVRCAASDVDADAADAPQPFSAPTVDVSSPGRAAVDRERLRLFPWYHAFLGRLDERVRLVGCTISCTYATHVQSYVLAMDFVTLQILWQARGLRLEDVTSASLVDTFLEHQRKHQQAQGTAHAHAQQQRRPMPLEKDHCRWQQQGGLSALLNSTTPTVILACHRDFYSTVFDGEVGISQAVLRAGYGIAALELYWRGVDFTLQPSLCSRVPAAINTYNHYENGVPDTRLRPWEGALYFNDPLHVHFTKFKQDKHYGSDNPLRAVLAWEQLWKRADSWQRQQQQTQTQTHNAEEHR